MDYAELKKSLEQTKKQMSECFIDYLKGEFQKLFDKYPMLNSLSWTQYTPYFNDGDTCHFSVYAYFEDDDISFQEGFEDDDENEYGYGKVYNEVSELASDIIESCEKNDLAEHLGDGVKVTVTKDGFEIDEYDHD